MSLDIFFSSLIKQIHHFLCLSTYVTTNTSIYTPCMKGFECVGAVRVVLVLCKGLLLTHTCDLLALHGECWTSFGFLLILKHLLDKLASKELDSSCSTIKSGHYENHMLVYMESIQRVCFFPLCILKFCNIAFLDSHLLYFQFSDLTIVSIFLYITKLKKFCSV